MIKLGASLAIIASVIGTSTAFAQNIPPVQFQQTIQPEKPNPDLVIHGFSLGLSVADARAVMEKNCGNADIKTETMNAMLPYKDIQVPAQPYTQSMSCAVNSSKNIKLTFTSPASGNVLSEISIDDMGYHDPLHAPRVATVTSQVLAKYGQNTSKTNQFEIMYDIDYYYKNGSLAKSVDNDSGCLAVNYMDSLTHGDICLNVHMQIDTGDLRRPQEEQPIVDLTETLNNMKLMHVDKEAMISQLRQAAEKAYAGTGNTKADL